MIPRAIFCLSLACALSAGHAQPTRVLIRCDDLGMCHSVTVAAREVLEQGIPVSTSVMPACPWFHEAVELLKHHPLVSVGVHLTLNAEWTMYRWGPVAGASAVPSLVDTLGYFFPTTSDFLEHGPSGADVERELRAQIDRAIRSGLHVDYLDYHMGTAVSTPALRAIVERLAADYGLGISRYFGETSVEGLYSASPEVKVDTLVALTRRLVTGSLNLFVFHIGVESPEMDALQDSNPSGLSHVSRHRNAERAALVSQEFRAALKEKNAVFVTYRDLVALQKGNR